MESTDASAGQGARKLDVFAAARWGDQALARAHGALTAARYEAAESWVEKTGHVALIVAAALGLAYGLVGAIKGNQLSLALLGIVWIPCVAVAQFCACKFLSTSRNLVRTCGSRLSSNALLSCIALWCLLLGIIVIAAYTYMAIRADSLSAFGLGLIAFAGFELVAWLCLNPSLLNVSILPEASAGEDAVGLVALALKVFLRLVPITFAAGVIAGDFEILAAIIGLFREGSFPTVDVAVSARMVISAALLPLAGYVLFVLGYLALDVIRAVLSIPGKLDVIAKK